MTTAVLMIVLCAAAPASGAEPRNLLQVTMQVGGVIDDLAIGPGLTYGRRLASWRRLDAFVGTTQFYRFTPALGGTAEFGAGTSRREYRHHWSSLVGPGARLRLPPADRLALGVDVLAGWAYLGIHGRFEQPAHGIDRSYAASDFRWLVGTRLWASFRVGTHWSALISYWQPLHVAPTSSWHLGFGAARAF